MKVASILGHVAMAVIIGAGAFMTAVVGAAHAIKAGEQTRSLFSNKE